MKCRHCGSGRTMLKGPSIQCKDCHRTSSKIPRRVIVPAKDRPSCPECGSSNPYARSIIEGIRRWICRSCGRGYKSTYITSTRDKVELSTMEVQVE